MSDFTTWAAVRTALKNAIQDHIDNGKALIGGVSINGKQMQYNGLQSIMDLIDMTYKMEAKETGIDRHNRVSFGRFRRY